MIKLNSFQSEDLKTASAVLKNAAGSGKIKRADSAYIAMAAISLLMDDPSVSAASRKHLGEAFGALIEIAGEEQ